ncbi:MAG: hypothetical protein EOM10_12165 [Opitutae bacterium]|nr:hypothetical protein [Opitutae bacterium]
MKIGMANNFSVTLSATLRPGDTSFTVKGFQYAGNEELDYQFTYLTFRVDNNPVAMCMMTSYDDELGTATFDLQDVTWSPVPWTGPVIPDGTMVEQRVCAELLDALGWNTGAGNNSVQISPQLEPPEYAGFCAVAVGYAAEASCDSAVSLGYAARALDDDAVALGRGSEALGIKAVAIGKKTSAVGEQSIACGYRATTPGANALAVGNGATATATDAIAIGLQVSASGGRSTAIGSASSASVESAIAIGDGASSTGVAAVRIGMSGYATALAAIAIGTNTEAYGEKSVAVGLGAQTDSADCIAIGSGSASSGTGSLSLGSGAESHSENCIAIGTGATANAPSGVALGTGAGTGSPYTVAVGPGAQAMLPYSVAIGQAAASTTSNQAVIASLFCLPPAGTDNAPVDADDRVVRHRAVPCSAISSQSINLGTVAGANQITLPPGMTFFIDRIDVIQTAASTATTQPQISIGVSGTDKVSILAATAVTLAGVNTRQSFTPASSAGVTSVYIDVPTAADAALAARVVFVGYLAG